MTEVVDWRPVARTWLRHRPEPLLHERLWGCDAVPSAEEVRADRCHWAAGFDADGRPVAVRQATSGAGEEIHRDGREIVVRSRSDVVARTTLDDAGRPLRTEYPRIAGEETYTYDEAGRLVVIDESPSLFQAVHASGRADMGGALAVEHDEQGPVRILGLGTTIWEREVPQWPDGVSPLVDRFAATIMEDIATAADAVPDGTAVFAASLTYVDQGSLHVIVNLGPEDLRRSLRADGVGGEDLAADLLYLPMEEPLGYLEPDILTEVDWGLLRAACVGQTGDAYRAALTLVARRLLELPWPARLERTDDFVVFIAEHDEGLLRKAESIRQINPAAQVARWEAGFPLDSLVE